jgi:outer membrane protein assembly factor BamB
MPRMIRSAFIALLLGGTVHAGEAPVYPAIAETKVESGLCVVVGARPVTELAALSSQGRMLVECLVPDRTAADALRAEVVKAGLSGLVTVKHQPAGSPLPYVNTTVNLLVADQVDAAEAARVVAPFGATVIAGKATIVPLPKDMDEWPQANRDPEQSNWSRDQKVGPAMGFRWIAPQISNRGLQDTGGPQKVPIRLAGGRIITYISEVVDEKRLTRLEARNAFNGARLWEIPAELPDADHHAQYVIATPERVYAFLNPSDGKAPLTCLDARTGAVIREIAMPEAFTIVPPKPDTNKGPRNSPEVIEYNRLFAFKKRSLDCAQVIIADGLLIVQREHTIAVFDEASGKPLWHRSWPDVALMNATVAQGHLVLVQEQSSTLNTNDRGAGLGPYVNTVIGLDPATGKEQWSRTDVLGEPGQVKGYLSQPPLVFQDRVVMVAKLIDYPGTKTPAAPNTTMPAGFAFACLDPATGKTRWVDRTKDTGGTIDANIWWISGSFINAKGELWIGYVGDHTALDTATGKLVAALRSPGTNCFWNRGVGDWKTTGFHWFNTIKHEYALQGSVRPGCNDGIFPAYGAAYSYNHLCACAKWIIGRVAMVAGPLPVPVPDSERLETFSPLVLGQESAAGWRSLFGNDSRGGRISGSLPSEKAVMAWRTNLASPLPAGPIAQDWANDATVRDTTPATFADGAVIVARGNQHAIVCLDPATGAERWRTVLGGRIDSPPTLWRGNAFVGCRDGWVYALDLKNGAIRWRHLVASDRRQMVNGGQLESLWPVLGTVIIHDGALYACGGITAQYDGGLWMTRLDPLTGKAVWRQRVLSPTEWGNSIRNEPIAFIDGRIWMDKISFDPATGSPLDEVLVSSELINRQGERLPEKKPRRAASNMCPRIEDPRTPLSISSSWNQWHGYGGAPFAGLSGSLHVLLYPGCRTDHRGGAVGSWTTDDNGHYRIGDGNWGRKGNEGTVGGSFTAWEANDASAGKTKGGNEPRWKTTAGTTVGMAMDADRIAVVTSGSGKATAFTQGNLSKPILSLYQRSDGTKVGDIALPGQVTWRGIASADGKIVLSFEDGSVGMWK